MYLGILIKWTKFIYYITIIVKIQWVKLLSEHTPFSAVISFWKSNFHNRVHSFFLLKFKIFFWYSNLFFFYLFIFCLLTFQLFLIYLLVKYTSHPQNGTDVSPSFLWIATKRVLVIHHAWLYMIDCLLLNAQLQIFRSYSERVQQYLEFLKWGMY